MVSIVKKIWIVLLLFLVSCTNKQNVKNELIIYTPYPQSFIQPVVQEFEQSTGQRVHIIHDSTRKLISGIEDTDKKKRGHVFVGGSLSELEDSNKIIEGEIHPFILMPSVFIINKDLIGNIQVDSYSDLKQHSLYKNFSYPNPTLTNTGFQHLHALKELYGDEGANHILDLGVRLEKTAEIIEHVISGRSYVGLTYEFTAMDYIDKGYPLKIVYPSDGTIINTDGIVKIDGPGHPKSEKFIAYLRSKSIQTHLSNTFHIKSARQDVPFKPYKVLKPLSDINVIQKGFRDES